MMAPKVGQPGENKNAATAYPTHATAPDPAITTHTDSAYAAAPDPANANTPSLIGQPKANQPSLAGKPSSRIAWQHDR